MTTLKGSFSVGVLIIFSLESTLSVSDFSPLSDCVSKRVVSRTTSFSINKDEAGVKSSVKKVKLGELVEVRIGNLAVWVVISLTISCLAVDVTVSSTDRFPKAVSVELHADRKQMDVITHSL